MSQQNIERYGRALDAFNRRDATALCEMLDPDVEWHPGVAASLSGKATVHRGHEGVREALRDQTETFAELRIEMSEIRDLGDRIVAIGQMRGRGLEGGAETESPVAHIVDYKQGKATRVRAYLDPDEALKVADLRE